MTAKRLVELATVFLFANILVGCSGSTTGGQDAGQDGFVLPATVQGATCSTVETVETPVKVMFVIDCSGSMAQLDEGNQRVEAVREVVQAHASRPEVTFSVIKFNQRAEALTNGFMHLSGDEPEIFGPTGLGESDAMSSYEAGLGLAYEVLLADMVAADPAERAVTRYLVLFLTDGLPDPVCWACVTGPHEHPLYHPDCDEETNLLCIMMDDILVDPTQLEDVEHGQDYNTDPRVIDLAGSIDDLGVAFGVADFDLTFHHLACWDTNGNPTSALCEAANAAYALRLEQTRDLLVQMAAGARGTYTYFDSGSVISFQAQNYLAVEQPGAALDILVTNRNARPGVGGIAPDSDGDGLADAMETELGTDPLLPDTDDDGYNDLIEALRLAQGFDPLRDDMPAQACLSLVDADGDRLRQCEEELYQSDDRLVDTDYDGIPDSIEVRLFLEPTGDDMSGDSDQDGRDNLTEIRQGTDPVSRDDPSEIAYKLTPDPDAEPGTVCLDFEVTRPVLVPTLQRAGFDAPGYNDVLVWLRTHRPEYTAIPSIFRVACVRVHVDAPESASIELTDADFFPLVQLDLGFESSHCVVVE